jgi:hypothetical protein
MTDLQLPADVTAPESIQLRADARLTKKIRFLQNELNGKSALVATLSNDLATAQHRATENLARIKQLEADVAAAKADADVHQKNFDRLVVALRAAKSGEFAHVVAALQRARVQQ